MKVSAPQYSLRLKKALVIPHRFTFEANVSDIPLDFGLIGRMDILKNWRLMVDVREGIFSLTPTTPALAKAVREFKKQHGNLAWNANR